ncbi:MAG: DUF5706 domain-containing protein [Muricomes sp.]
MGKDTSQPTGCYTKEDAYQSLQMVNSWISNIDAKISFTMAFVAVLMGFVFSNGIPRVFIEISKLNGVQQISCAQVFFCILVIALYLLCLLSIASLIMALTARVKNTSIDTSVFFFADIAKRTFDDLKNDMDYISEGKLLKDLQGQIYVNSQICTKKAKFFNYGLYYFVSGIFLYFICSSLQVL